jgi:hypothetical protein
MNEQKPEQDKEVSSVAVGSNAGLDKLPRKNKRGCPTCGGVDPKSCLRCFGRTRMSEWMGTDALKVSNEWS